MTKVAAPNSKEKKKDGVEPEGSTPVFMGKYVVEKTYHERFGPTQGIIPALLTDFLDICDSLVVFDEIMRKGST